LPPAPFEPFLSYTCFDNSSPSSFSFFLAHSLSFLFIVHSTLVHFPWPEEVVNRQPPYSVLGTSFPLPLLRVFPAPLSAHRARPLFLFDAPPPPYLGEFMYVEDWARWYLQPFSPVANPVHCWPVLLPLGELFLLLITAIRFFLSFPQVAC